ncbi:hypothetical protein ACR30L_01425 [Psychromonas sp. PT13]|uniref:hypothetical protein n=1 Tax=Psychromonas sp. PT13 TaxID=3439547 RepID=UPI003EB75A44
MLNILKKGLFNFLVEKSTGLKIATVVAVVLCGGVIYKGWQNHQKNEVFKLVNENIEVLPTASGNQWVVNWVDNADDETGFKIERKQGVSGDFSLIATVDSDMTSYTDSDITNSGTYCYQIGAFNNAGTAYSDEACIDVTVMEDEILDSSNTLSEVSENVSSFEAGSADISYDFVDKITEINLEGREFYSFKSDATYNSEFSDDSVSSINYKINDGKMYYVDSSSLFVLKDQEEELDNGFVSMNYDSSNNVDFTLNGNGEEQVASVYLSIGAWTDDEASILISAGENSETITLPKGYTWYYLKIDITFDTLAQVTIKPLGSFGGYSKIKVAGVLLNNATEGYVVEDEVSESEPGVAYFNFANLDSVAEIDITDTEYVTSEFITGNTDLSSGSVSAINYEGTSKYADGIYTFIDNGDTVALGNTQISWDKDSSISLKLNSDNDDFVQASLYLQAGAWVSTDIKTIELILTLNGEEHIIELTKGYKWFYIRIDFEFSGEVEVKLNPESSIGGYSKIKFAGLTMQ